MEQRDILGHHGDRRAQALLGDQGNVLAVDQDAAALHVIEPLQQREQARFAAAGGPHQAHALAAPQREAEILEDLAAVRVFESDVFERDAGTLADQWRRLRVVAQLVRDQQRRERFRKAGHVLGHIDQSHREVPGGMQDRQAQRADQHHLSGRGAAVLPQHERPGHETDRQHHRDQRVQ